MLYPSLVDRYRVAQVLIQSAWRIRRRTKRGLNQAALARAADVSQPTVSIAMNLGDIAAKNAHAERRLIDRRTLVSVLARGLQMERTEIDLVLWLYDGEPLKEYELVQHRDVIARSDGKHSSYTEVALREATLDRVRRALPGAEGSRHEAVVEVLFRRDEHARLAAEELLLELESLPGQRLVASRYPSFVTTPRRIAAQSSDFEPGLRSASVRAKYKRVLIQRIDLFEKHLNTYGERAIYSKRDLQQYARRDAIDWRDPRRRRAQLENCADLLEKYRSKFQIALTDRASELEMSVKVGTRAAVRGTPSNVTAEREGWGIRYLIWNDLPTVYSFVCEFEEHWDSIPKADRENESVAKTIRRFLATG